MRVRTAYGALLALAVLPDPVRFRLGVRWCGSTTAPAREPDVCKSLLQDSNGDLQHQSDRRHHPRLCRHLSGSDSSAGRRRDHLARRSGGDDPQRDEQTLPCERFLYDRRTAKLLGGLFSTRIRHYQPHRGDPHHEHRRRPRHAVRSQDRRRDRGHRLVSHDHAERDRRQRPRSSHLRAVLRRGHRQWPSPAPHDR